jgi:outer membrane protein assembly factor BamB
VVAVGRRDVGDVVKGVAEKYDAAGRLLWRPAVTTGEDGDGFLAAAVAGDGRVYAAGASAFPDAGEAGPYVVALRPSGRVAWWSQWNHEGWGQRIVVAGAKVYVATSLVEGAADNEVVGVECLNAANGSTTWRREYDAGSGVTRSEINDLTVVPGQSLYVAAAIEDDLTGSDGWFLRLQP